jgi:GNAT superfamily N-acetyltransferase
LPVFFPTRRTGASQPTAWRCKNAWEPKAFQRELASLAGMRVENLVARVEEFIVHPASLRPVAGRALLDSIESEANRLNCEVVLLFVHVDAAPAAYEFYQNCGYQEQEMNTWPPAWRTSAEEFGGADRFVIAKRLREELVTRPI